MRRQEACMVNGTWNIAPRVALLAFLFRGLGRREASYRTKVYFQGISKLGRLEYES